MKLPIAAEKLTFIVTGDAMPVRVYGTEEVRSDEQGRPLFKIPVLITGTGAKNDPSTTITIAGPIPGLQRGVVKFRGLVASTWTVRGNDGKERTGITLRADGIEIVKP